MNRVNSVKNIKHVERYFQRGFFGNSFDNSDQKAARSSPSFFERNYKVHVKSQIKSGLIKIEISAIATMDEALLRLQVRCAIDKV